MELCSEIENECDQFDVFCEGHCILIVTEDEIQVFNVKTQAQGKLLNKGNYTDLKVKDQLTCKYTSSETEEVVLSTATVESISRVYGGGQPMPQENPEGITFEKIDIVSVSEPACLLSDLGDYRNAALDSWVLREISEARDARGGIKEFFRSAINSFESRPDMWEVSIRGTLVDTVIARQKPQTVLINDTWYIFVCLWNKQINIYTANDRL